MSGTGEGSRTLNPVRERDFESRAYAIPPLRPNLPLWQAPTLYRRIRFLSTVFVVRYGKKWYTVATWYAPYYKSDTVEFGADVARDRKKTL